MLSTLNYEDKFIDEYNIEFNQFVWMFEGADCMRFSNADSDIIKCITIIDNYNNDEYFVNMNKLSTVRMLKSIIAKKYGLNEKEFYLEFNKNNMLSDDDATLEQCGLSDGCIIHLVNENFMLFIKNYGRIYGIYLNKYSTVDKLKQMIRQRIGFNLSNIVLCYNGSEISDGYKLNDYGICNGDTVMVTNKILGGLYIRLFEPISSDEVSITAISFDAVPITPTIDNNSYFYPIDYDQDAIVGFINRVVSTISNGIITMLSSH